MELFTLYGWLDGWHFWGCGVGASSCGYLVGMGLELIC